MDDEGSESVVLWAMLATVLGTLFFLYCLAVLLDWVPGLRGWGNYPEGWTWPTYPFPPVERFLAPIAAVVLIWVVVTITEISQRARHAAGLKGSRTVKAVYLLLLLILGYGLQLGLLGLKAENPNALLVERVTSRVFTGYYNLAASAPGIDAFFSKYPDVFNTKTCPHCHSHPPGPALFYWLNIHTVDLLPSDTKAEAADQLQSLLGSERKIVDLESNSTNAQLLGAFTGGSLVLLIAAAVVFPMFGLARLLGPPGGEYKLASLGLALPGLMLMSPQFDQTLATVSAAVLYLAIRGLLAPSVAGAALWSLAAGVAISLGIFFSWSQASMLAVIVALGLGAVIGSRRILVAKELEEPTLPAAHWLTAATAAAVGTALPLALLAILTKTDLAYIFRYNLNNEVLAEAKRPYSIWVVQGPIDFVQFFGLPLAATALVALIVRPWSYLGQGRLLSQDAPAGLRSAMSASLPARVNMYAVVFWLGLLAIDLAGKSKAEQGRLLIFLMPLGLCAFYLWIGRLKGAPALVTTLFFAQMVITIIIGARWLVP